MGAFSLNAQEDTDDLARVSILKFFDNTKQQSFGYLSASIAEAIDKSMQQRFEYKKLKITRKSAKKVARAKEIRQLAKNKGADFIIYGHYNFDKKKNQILIYVNIYIAYTNKNIKIDVVRNPVDASLFSATEIVAAKIVGEIQKIATEQEKEKEQQITLIFSQGKANQEAKIKGHARRLAAYLGQKYKGQFLTYEEYQAKTGKNNTIKPSEKKKLFSFMGQEGIKKSYFIKMKGKNFVLEAREGSKLKKSITYSIKSSPETLEKQWAASTRSLSLEKRKRVSLDKSKLQTKDGFINRKISFGFHAGYVFPFINFDFSDTETEGPMLSLFGRYRIWQMVHAGLQLSRNAFSRSTPVTVGSSSVNVRVKGEYYSALATGGYTYNLSPKWQFLGELGFGYYYGETKSEYEATDSSGFIALAGSPTITKNPVLMIQFEANYVLLKWLAVGFHTNFFLLFDKSESEDFAPLGGASTGISAIFAF